MGILISRALDIYELIILVRIFMSWIHPDPYHPLVRFIMSITDPVLEPIRKMLPSSGMGLDFSPMIVFILIEIIKNLVLTGYGYGY